MTSPSGRLSFKQWLMISFLIMGLLFGVSYFIAINTLDYLSNRSQDTASSAVQLNELSQDLANVRESMERHGRQYTVLNHEDLLKNYQEAKNKSLNIIQQLLQAQALTPEQTQQWTTLTEQITHTLATAEENHAPSSQTDNKKLLETFKKLESLQLGIHLQIQYMTELKSKQLVSDIAQRQSWMKRIMIGLIALTVTMLFVFATWLAGPFKRIEAAILRLGENQFSNPIEIDGPTDVRKLGQRLDWLRIRLAEIDADKTRFLRHTSHEFKTPLAALREGISLLQEELAGSLNSDQKDVVRILQQSIITLQNQIEDLLKFNAAAFDARNLDRKPTPLLDLIDDQVDTQQLQWQASNLQINVDGQAITLEIDAEKIATAISNLLSNAIRFSPYGGQINIHVSVQNKLALIDITDQGAGIDEDDRLHIFDPFYRGKRQPASKASGTGIGLSIVYELIAAHGGGIQLLPSDQGAHFRIQLPYADIS